MEIQVKGCLKSNTKVGGKRLDIVDKLKDHHKEDIDIAVHNEFKLVAMERERPYISIKRLHKTLMQDADFPRMSREGLRKALHSLGYRFLPTQTDRNLLLIDTPDLLEKRKRSVIILLLPFKIGNCIFLFLQISQEHEAAYT